MRIGNISQRVDYIVWLLSYNHNIPITYTDNISINLCPIRVSLFVWCTAIKYENPLEFFYN